MSVKSVAGAVRRAGRRGAALGAGALVLSGCQFGGLNSLNMPGTAGHGRGSYSVTVQLPDRPNVLSVPPAALVRQDGKTGVFVIADGRVRFRPVRVGVRAESGIEVVDGLSGGEAVIVQRLKPIADGDRVRVTSSGGEGK